MEIHELNTKALTSPAYVAADDGDDTYKFDFEAIKAVIDGQISAQSARSDDVENDVEALEARPRIWYGSTSTLSNTANKIVDCADFALKDGDYIVVSFSQGNTASAPTLNVNGTGANHIVNGPGSNASFPIDAGDLCLFHIRYQSNTSEWYFDSVGHIYGEATTTAKGYMSAADKTALNGAVSDITELADELDENKIWFGTSTTSADTAEKVVTCADFELVVGRYIAVQFTQANTATGVKLNVNNTGAITVRNLKYADGYMPIDYYTTVLFRVYKHPSQNTWRYEVIGQLYGDATTSAHGLMSAADKTALNNLVSELADFDTGTYPGMTVGNAEQLLSDVYTEDKEPYKYRASFSGDREFDEIVGGTVAWNQLCNSASVTVTNGHKYLLKKSSAWSIGASTGTAITGLTNGSDMVIDLTQLFGSTIADYIYAQEQATAGAGVAIFRKLFPASYYAYNAGELISVSGLSAHETVGFNAFEIGSGGTKNGLTFTVNSDGTLTVSGTATGTNYFDLGTVKLIANQPYEICGCPSSGGSGKYGLALYDGETVVATDFGAGAIYTPTKNETLSVRVCYWYNAATNITIKPCVHLVRSGSRNGEYEPYQKHSYPLDSSLTLRGIPKLADGKMYFDGDTYQSDGTVTRRYGIVDLGSLTWTYLNDGIFRAPRVADMFNYYYPNWICGKYLVGSTTNYAGWKTVNKKIGFLEGYQFIICMDTSYTDAATFKTAMSGVYLVYELATPTTETAEPFTNPQIVSEYGTEEYISGTICPVGHVTKYPENLRKKIEGLPWNLSMIAHIENGTTASKAYSVGQYFLHNNVFCKAKTSIASGATFTLNTNYEETTVAAEVYTALH